MSAMSEECKLSFYEEIASLREDRQFWLVRQKQTGKFYVKKKLSTSNREVYRALRAIDSRNLPRIYECISLGEELIVIEELINGDTLTDLMQREKISPGRAALIMMDICDVLCILHAMKPPVIHRDIKPGNIMISNDGVVKLMDFDIARRLWKMAVATVAYGFLLNAFAMGNFKSSSEGELIATRLLSGLGALGGILVLFNYLGVADRLPGAKRFHGWASWLLRFAYAVAVFFLGICILVVLLDFTQ